MDLQIFDKIVETLIFPMWRGIDPEYKSKYKRDIWQQFENGLRSAASTSKLSTFFETFKMRFNIVIRAEHRSNILAGLQLDDEKTLTHIREDTAILVLLCQTLNNERKENYEQALKAREEAQAFDIEQMNKDIENDNK